MFELDQGLLWHRATAKKPQQLVLCAEDLFEDLAEVYFKLGHVAVEKTYGLAAKQYDLI